MSKIKCSIFRCEKHMSIPDREVYSVRIASDGWRLICKDHDEAIKNGTLKPTLEAIYGPRQQKRNKVGFKPKKAFTKEEATKDDKSN